MPKYAPDLTEYLASICEDAPTEALANPDLLRRALSVDAPIGLVAKVAEALENIDTNPVVGALTLYERGRIMSALGRREESILLYKLALESCTDPKRRGQILVNLANDVESPEEKLQLLRQAVDEGDNEALAHLGMFLNQIGQTEMALNILLASVRKGVSLGIPLIGEMYFKTKSGEELVAALHELYDMAKAAGIEDPVEAPFQQWGSQTVAQSSKTGRIINILADWLRMRKAS